MKKSLEMLEIFFRRKDLPAKEEIDGKFSMLNANPARKPEKGGRKRGRRGAQVPPENALEVTKCLKPVREGIG